MDQKASTYVKAAAGPWIFEGKTQSSGPSNFNDLSTLEDVARYARSLAVLRKDRSAADRLA